MIYIERERERDREREREKEDHLISCNLYYKGYAKNLSDRYRNIHLSDNLVKSEKKYPVWNESSGYRSTQTTLVVSGVADLEGSGFLVGQML